jgi:hypothetical protein
MERCPAVSLQMNYLDRTGRREIIINTEEHTFHLDLVKQEYKKNQEHVSSYSLDKDETYRNQHNDMLNNHGKLCCSLLEGLDVMRMIDATEKSAETETWQKNRHLR